MPKYRIGNIFFGIFTLIYCWGIFTLSWPISPYFLFFFFFLLCVGSGSFLIRLNYHLIAINKKKTNEKIVAITFDDGPSEFTIKVLDLLKKHDAKATFFCIGKNIELQQDVLEQINKEGHTIGNHSYSHAKIGFQSTEEIIREIHKTDTMIEEITGKKNTFYRPPFGVTNPNIRKAIKETKHQVIGWNIRSLDTAINEEGKILKRITKRIKPGSIILLHDTSEKSINVLEQLLQYLHENEYKSVSIEELLTV